MLSLQEIQSVTFEKAVFGGYDMRSVDDFVEKVTEDYGALQKENAALKAKMKVLVDKIEEYRSVEDGMRKALLSAQNIASDTVEKAKKERENILQDARNQAESKVDEFHSRVEEEEEKLNQAKRETKQFIQHILAQYSDMAHKLQNMAEDEVLVTREQPVAQAKPAEEPTIPIQPMTGAAVQPTEPVITPEKEAAIEEADEELKDSISEELSAYMNRKMEEEKPSRYGMAPEREVPQTTAKFDFGELKFKGKDR